MRAYTFSTFRLMVEQRQLYDGSETVHLGGRTLDLLTLLVERAGGVVDKREILSRIWPGDAVEEATLRVHMAALRKALGDGRDRARFIVNVPGHGYSFVAEARSVEVTEGSPLEPRRSKWPSAVPAALVRLVGCSDSIRTLLVALDRHRIITVVGPGGIGKTALALEVARRSAGNGSVQTCFVDLSSLDQPERVPHAIAMALGLPIVSEAVVLSVVAALRSTETLLVLDNCEHVIDGVARTIEKLVPEVPNVQVLATSREPIRVSGEWLFRVPGLTVSPPDASLDEVRSCDAVQLFGERAAANSDAFDLSQENVAQVAEVCRKLDGIPLAIELAAAMADLLGVDGLAARLDDRFRLLTRGRRTASPRQRTLKAALDWSHDLLTPEERIVLRRLALIRGPFDLEEAITVSAYAELSEGTAVEALSGLVLKSLLAADAGPNELTYRLLETTRAYGNEQLVVSGERDEVARRHARHLQRRLQAMDWSLPSSHPNRALAWLADNVRGALDWAFSPADDPLLAAKLVLTASPLWSRLSLWQDSRYWVERALTCLPEDANEGLRMELDAALAMSLLHTQGVGTESSDAWRRVLVDAKRLSDIDYQLRALWGLSITAPPGGRRMESLRHARSYHRVATTAGTPSDILVGRGLIGRCCLFRGDLRTARRELEDVSRRYRRRSYDLERFQSDQYLAVRNFLAPTLWLLGHSQDAARIASENLVDALRLGHPVSLLYVLIHAACPIPLLRGDAAAVDESISAMEELCAVQQGWLVWLNYYLAWRWIERGKPEVGGELLAEVLASRPESLFTFYLVPMLGLLARSSIDRGRLDDGISILDRALGISQHRHERWWVPELLRLKGEAFARLQGPTSIVDAERELRRSMEVARRQSALTWELRALVSLIRVLEGHRGAATERRRLATVCARLRDDDSEDLLAARSLLEIDKPDPSD